VRAATAALAVSFTLLAPSPALAAKSFAGKTKQQRSVALTVGDDQLLQRLRVNWIARRCSTRGSRFQHITTFRPPFDASTPDAFHDAGAFTVRDRGGFRSRVRITLDGTRDFDPANPAAESWSGTLRARVVVRRRGKVIDRCRLRSIPWSAALQP
jgi:hypothetical protein